MFYYQISGLASQFRFLSIDEKALKAIAVKVTIQRRRIRDQALAADSKISGGNIKPSEISTSLAQKIVKGYHSSKKLEQDR